MIVKSINKIKDSIHIVFDNGEKLILRYEVYLKNGIRKEDDVDDKKVALLIRENQIFYIKESAFRFLGLRLHSAKELERKLQSKKYDKELVSEVIRDLKEYNYLDDEKFTREYTEEKLNKKSLGLNRIRLELRGKGVPPEIIESVLGENSETDEFQHALKLAQKKYETLINRNFEKMKIHQKIYTFLISKGFHYDIIKAVLDKLE